MDPIRNPYAPGAGQRPPELAGRGEQLAHFDVVLERVARSRPERSLILTGLRGVGKTVLLNALRGQAVRARWGTGKLESRPDQTLRRPLGAALHMAVRELGHPDTDQILGEIRAFIERDAKPGAKLAERWNPGIRVPAVKGRADSGDIEIDPNDVRVDVYRSSGPGGQSVNTTDSAVRLTHIPTGLVVSMQNEKSQLQNKEAAFRVLRSRLLQLEQEKRDAEAAQARASQVRTVDRSERIRTYNFPENRIADHRTGYKAYNLDAVLNGDLGPVIQSAIEADEAARLAAVGQGE